MKVVIDTNIFISGIFWGGAPFKILELWKNKKIELVSTDEILKEYFDVIERLVIPENKKLAIKWKNYIKKNITIITNKSNHKISRDKDDDKFIQCALSGKIKYLVSGDNDLIVLKRYKTVNILKVKDFLEDIIGNKK